MTRRGKIAVWLLVIIVAGGGGVAAVLLIRAHKVAPILLKGAVISEDADVNKEQPIADVEITVADDLGAKDAKSDSSGYFSLTLQKGIKRGQRAVLKFRHPGYKPLDMSVVAGDQLYLARMEPIPGPPQPSTAHGPEVVVSNVVVRYSVKATSAVNVGSAVKTFEVANRGNVLCNGQKPCSPDGKWRAATGSVSLDAGEGNAFRNTRISCIAGPCPFTRIESNRLSQDGRILTVSALDWSDTTTFLVEAEVFHPMVSDAVRVSYPVIFGPALNFTLPAGVEGLSIQADMNGAAIVFPLGPDLYLNWASCQARVNKDQTEVYRCELKPGFRFR